MEPVEEPVPVVAPWSPALPISDDSSLSDVITSLSFGSGDVDSWMAIKVKVNGRGIFRVGDLKDWSSDELTSLIRNTKIAKCPRAYLKALGMVVNIDLLYNPATGQHGLKKEAGGQRSTWFSHCTKVERSEEFGPYNYKPDGRVFAHLPRKGSCAVMDDEEEALAVDLFWLDAHANPEVSLGDYLPFGVPQRLARVCDEMLPAFAPTKKGVARQPKKIISLRHQNARDAPAPYKRMILCSEFQEVIQPRSRGSVTWVEPSSEALIANVRNGVMSDLVDMYRNGKGEPELVALPSEAKKTAATASTAAAAAATASAAAAAAVAASASAAQASADIADDTYMDADLDALDGAEFEEAAAGATGAPPLPKARFVSRTGEGAIKTKKSELAEKSGSAANKPKRPKGPKKSSANKYATTGPTGRALCKITKKRAPGQDSSDADSSDDEGAHKKSKGHAPPPSAKPPQPALRQTVLKPTISLVEVDKDHVAVTASAVEPALTPANAVGRFVFVPGSQWQLDIGGWVAKISKMGSQKDPTVDIQFKDMDGDLTKEYFKFSHVLATFKPLS